MFENIKVGDEIAYGMSIEKVVSVSAKRFKTESGEYNKSDGKGFGVPGYARFLTPELREKIIAHHANLNTCKSIQDQSHDVMALSSCFYSSWTRRAAHHGLSPVEIEQINIHLSAALKLMKKAKSK